jgi:hypothetical protein
VYLLAYVSVTTQSFSEKDLIDLLSKSREHNASHDITGLLLYSEPNFMQVLEGPKAAVLSLLDRIRSDSRHHGLIVVLQEEHANREFPQWAMGFQHLDSIHPLNISGYTHYHKLPMTAEEFLLNPARSLQYLLSFKDKVRDGDYTRV